MPNTLLTPDMITREALRVLHQKLKFIGSVNRAYDSSFAQSGAKIGDTLRIRLPNQYTVRNGATASFQDTVEQSTTLQVSTQKGVDLQFTSVDLALDLDNFSKHILEPAMAQLAASMESDFLNTACKDVYNVINNIGSSATFAGAMQARAMLEKNLAPENDRYVLMNNDDNVSMVDALKGLFNSQETIGRQNREGMLGRTAGLDFMETTHFGTQARGSANGSYLTNGASQTGSSIIVDTGTGTLAVGDVVTFAGVFRVHPESKIASTELQQFVITAAYAGGGGTIAISPAIVASGARQNVSNAVADNSAVTVVGTASTAYKQSLVYQKDAFTFATADLPLDDGMVWKSRQVYDGISMRIVKGYDITNDLSQARLDVLYGYKTIRPQTAVRWLNG